MALTLSQAVEALRAGKPVIFPTETVYGVGARFDSEAAILKVFESKRRPHFNPLIVHVLESHWLKQLVKEVDPISQHLMERFWPGPLTLVLPKLSSVSDLITAGLPTVGVRCPSHPVARELLTALNVPLAAPSANIFGTISATRYEDLDPKLVSQTAGAIAGGDCEVGLESTVVQVSDDALIILRHGAITKEMLEAVVSVPIRDLEGNISLSPGRTKSHYAPKTKLIHCPQSEIPRDDRTIGILLFQSAAREFATPEVEILSPSGDLNEAARKLFQTLKALDRKGFTKIYAETFPDEGLGIAINDRLTRAAS